MVKTARDALSDRAIWFLIALVILGVLLVLIVVVKHDEKKPQSPQALVAAAFNQVFPIQEWKPGMGKKPFIYHPAAFEWKPGMGKKPLMYHPAGLNQLVWRPLPSRAARQ